jgi:hypothetical protein
MKTVLVVHTDIRACLGAANAFLTELKAVAAYLQCNRIEQRARKYTRSLRLSKWNSKGSGYNPHENLNLEDRKACRWVGI